MQFAALSHGRTTAPPTILTERHTQSALDRKTVCCHLLTGLSTAQYFGLSIFKACSLCAIFPSTRPPHYRAYDIIVLLY